MIVLRTESLTDFSQIQSNVTCTTNVLRELLPQPFVLTVWCSMIQVVLKQNVITHSTSNAETENGSVSNHVLNNINLMCRKVFFLILIHKLTHYYYYSLQTFRGAWRRYWWKMLQSQRFLRPLRWKCMRQVSQKYPTWCLRT